MKLLLTNDDGFDAPGLEALAEALGTLGELTVVAPHLHVSGCSHQATTHRPLELVAHRSNWYKLDGSPVDCTRVGLKRLATDADWVVSGINAGGNLGADVYLSGTVAAVREACFLGRPAIAVSQYYRGGPIPWDISAAWAREIVVWLIENRRPQPGSFWNVNLPDPARFRGPQPTFCPLDTQPLPVDFVEQEGRLHYRGQYHDRQRAAGSDVDVCFAGGITITALGLSAHAPGRFEG